MIIDTGIELDPDDEEPAPDEPNEATEAAAAVVGAVASVLGSVLGEVVDILMPDDSPSSE